MMGRRVTLNTESIAKGCGCERLLDNHYLNNWSNWYDKSSYVEKVLYGGVYNNSMKGKRWSTKIFARRKIFGRKYVTSVFCTRSGSRTISQTYTSMCCFT